MTDKFMLLALVLTSWTLPVDSASSSPTPHAAVPAAEPVSIPFAPPIGVPLRYRVEKSTLSADEPRTIALDFTATFTRDGDGYRMVVAYIVPEATRSNASEAELALLAPLTFLLAADSSLVAIEDEAAYWAAIEAAVEASPRERTPAGPFARAFRGIIRGMRELPDFERMGKLGENILPILALSGVEMAVGRPETHTMPVATPFGPLSANVTTTLERVEDGIAHFASAIRIPNAEMERMMRTLFERLRPPGSPALPAMRVLAAGNSERNEVSVATGLARRYRAERSIEFEAAGRRERVGTVLTIERVE